MPPSSSHQVVTYFFGRVHAGGRNQDCVQDESFPIKPPAARGNYSRPPDVIVQNVALDQTGELI